MEIHNNFKPGDIISVAQELGKEVQTFTGRFIRTNFSIMRLEPIDVEKEFPGAYSEEEKEQVTQFLVHKPTLLDMDSIKLIFIVKEYKENGS